MDEQGASQRKAQLTFACSIGACQQRPISSRENGCSEAFFKNKIKVFLWWATPIQVIQFKGLYGVYKEGQVQNWLHRVLLRRCNRASGLNCSSQISSVYPYPTHQKVWALLQALSCNFPSSLICSELAAMLLTISATEKGKAKKGKKESFVSFSFWTFWEIETQLCHSLLACDRDLGRWAFFTTQSTKQENERKTVLWADWENKHMPMLKYKNAIRKI